MLQEGVKIILIFYHYSTLIDIHLKNMPAIPLLLKEERKELCLEKNVWVTMY